MFSFGIFTTHTPYVIMVVFYVYILIFGIEKTSKDEVVSDTFIKIEIETENFRLYTSEVYNYFFLKNFNVLRADIFKVFLIKSELKHPNYLHPVYKQDNYCYSQFSRPPPKA